MKAGEIWFSTQRNEMVLVIQPQNETEFMLATFSTLINPHPSNAEMAQFLRQNRCALSVPPVTYSADHATGYLARLGFVKVGEIAPEK